MPALRCPHCGVSDLHAVAVEMAEVNPKAPRVTAPDIIKVENRTELACKRCGWTPSADAHPDSLMDVHSIDDNV